MTEKRIPTVQAVPIDGAAPADAVPAEVISVIMPTARAVPIVAR